MKPTCRMSLAYMVCQGTPKWSRYHASKLLISTRCPSAAAREADALLILRVRNKESFVSFSVTEVLPGGGARLPLIEFPDDPTTLECELRLDTLCRLRDFELETLE